MADNYREAVQTLVKLGAERVLILRGPAPMKPSFSHGFDDQCQWSDQVSMGVVERSLAGEAVMVADIEQSPLFERWSVQLSGIRSVVCLPFWSPSSRVLGLLYIDTKSPHKTFGREAIAAMQRCAQMLEGSLHRQPAVGSGKAVESPKEPGVRLGLRRAKSPANPAIKGESTNSPAALCNGKRVDGRALSVFTRSLATMMRAGIAIDRSLGLLSQQSESAALASACRIMQQSVSRGERLSAAMHKTQVFEAFECALVEVGERTGSLDRVLLQMAELREKAVDSNLRLRSSLAYPAFLFLASLTAMLLAPPLVLRGQFELLRQSGGAIPLPTQLMVSLSDFLLSPLGWVLVLSSSVGLIWLWRRVRNQENWRQWFYARLVDAPVVGPVLLWAGCSLFARSLSISYRVGLPLHQGLQLAARVCAVPQIQRDIPKCLAALDQGASVSKTLEKIACLPSSFVGLVAAGQECGRLDSTLDWVANFFEMEFEASLDSSLALIQPVLIGLMGFLTALLLLVTLLPMATLLEKL